MVNRRNREIKLHIPATAQSTKCWAALGSRAMVRVMSAGILGCLFLLMLNGRDAFYSTIERKSHGLTTISSIGPTCILQSVPVSTQSSTRTYVRRWKANNYTDRFFQGTDKSSDSFFSFKGGKKQELTFRKNPLYIPSRCPTSIQQKMSNNNMGTTIYHPEIHLLMNSQLLNKSDYARLHPYNMPFGYKTKSRFSLKDVQATLTLFPAKNSIFEFSEDKPRPNCLSCAVIGNGGILNGSMKGSEIDGHDVIFRVNKAVRRNHEQDVGNRTTHYIFFDRSLRVTSASDVPNDEGLIYIFIPCRDNDYKYITAVVNGKDPKINASAKDVRLLHPDFVRYVNKIWVRSPRNSFRPTTGMLMLMTALHSGCDSVSVYGMGYNYIYSMYYYDSTFRRFRMDPKAHDANTELTILKGLDSAGIIDWNKRDVPTFRTR